MFTLFNGSRTAAIGIGKNAAEAVVLAARDLQRDLRALSGQPCGFPIVTEGGDIRISTEGGEEEHYRVSVCADGVSIVGGGVLGTVFGVYAFSTRVLGVDPMYRLNDVFLSTRAEMAVEDGTFCSPARAIRFRGWFLNDEDLLTGFKSGGGVRNLDYLFYQTVMHPDVLDMILETALRHEINLIIPSSFVDVDNPDEEKLAAAVVRRGMYVTQHHVEPLGVSYFSAQNYFKKHGCEGEISFITNRAVMEEIWEHYVRLWAKYGDRVIWQLGLRGRADEAVWKRDKNAPMSMEGRGALITDAIATQYETVKRVLGHENFFSTATLWMEGAELYGRGYLKLPDTTIPIFSDVGYDQMWGEDFFSTPRLDGVSYGVYYYVGYFDRGPHLSDGCDPRKMTYCYRLAHQMRSLDYSIVNVSNVRPLQYSVAYNAYVMSDPQNADYDAYSKAFHSRHFGDAAQEVMALRDAYYLAKTDLGPTELKLWCEKFAFYFHDYGDLPFPRYTADDGTLWRKAEAKLKGMYSSDCPDPREALERSESAFAALYDSACDTETRVPAESLDYYRIFVKYQIEYMLCLTRWAIDVFRMCDAEGEARLALGERAVSHLSRMIDARRVEAEGRWQGWHEGEKKLNFLQMIELTREAAREK